jgi:hypothetical protein
MKIGAKNGEVVNFLSFFEDRDCNTDFAKQNLVLNGDFVPTNYVGLHKILQNQQS